jgi:hypothetical protein
VLHNFLVFDQRDLGFLGDVLKPLTKMSFGAPGGGSVNYKPTPSVFTRALIFTFPLDCNAPVFKIL